LQTQARSEESLQVNMMRSSLRLRVSKYCHFHLIKNQLTKRKSSRKRSLWCKTGNQTKSKKSSLFWNRMRKRQSLWALGVKTLASLILKRILLTRKVRWRGLLKLSNRA
jgi:hypothetical protein